MKFGQKQLFYVPLPGMEVHLATCFFQGMTDRPPNRHIHPCYELICCEEENGNMSFTIVPPLFEHVMMKVPSERLCSLLFSFLPTESKNVCMKLQEIKQPTTIADTFGGTERIRSIKALTVERLPGSGEQIAAELHLLFICLARNLFADETETPPLQTLEEERLARLEEYFNIHLKNVGCCKQQLADELGVCERQLTRILQEVYHSNFSSILLRSRMNLAQAMLEQKEKSVAEIAEAVGYPSLSTFKRAYTKFFGTQI